MNRIGLLCASAKHALEMAYVVDGQSVVVVDGEKVSNVDRIRHHKQGETREMGGDGQDDYVLRKLLKKSG
jgi:hypothetical protein